MIHICDYGCEKEAKYQFKNGKWCCSKYFQSCPVIKKETGIKTKGRKYKNTFKPKYVENSGHVCDYGCGKEAHYQLKNGKWCCESYYGKCSISRIKNRERGKKQIHFNLKYIEKSENICDYGCEKEAHYHMKNGK